MTSRTQIIATIGPASEDEKVLEGMVKNGVDIIRFNLSWAGSIDFGGYIAIIRELEKKTGKVIKVVFDLPGPRIQEGKTHTYDTDAISSVTEKDKEYIKFGVEAGADYFALSFVGGAQDVVACKEVVASCGGNQKIIAKIEREVAVNNIDEILEVADGIMIARGDLGEEVPVEKIPFIEEDIIKKSKASAKPVIVATQMLLSMVSNPEPTRAEVTDISFAVTKGADVVMLSDETAIGKYPIESVATMEKIIQESEQHEHIPVNSL